MIARRTNEEWLVLYEQQRASGMTVKDWCETKGIKLPTMADRITRLRKMGLIKDSKPTRGKNSTGVKEKEKPKQTKSRKPWVEVKPAAVTFNDNDTSDENISVLIGDYKIKIRKGFEPEVLMEVCRVLVAL